MLARIFCQSLVKLGLVNYRVASRQRLDKILKLGYAIRWKLFNFLKKCVLFHDRESIAQGKVSSDGAYCAPPAAVCPCSLPTALHTPQPKIRNSSSALCPLLSLPTRFRNSKFFDAKLCSLPCASVGRVDADLFGKLMRHAAVRETGAVKAETSCQSLSQLLAVEKIAEPDSRSC